MDKLISFDTYLDIKQIVYGTLHETTCCGDNIPEENFLVLSEEITDRIIDYLQACEGIPV